MLAGHPSPIYMLKIGAGVIPFEFIHQFLAMGDRDYLCPVGTWSEGAKQREWSQMLTNHLVMMGFADKANSNKPARWVDYAGAMKWMGLEGE